MKAYSELSREIGKKKLLESSGAGRWQQDIGQQSSQLSSGGGKIKRSRRSHGARTVGHSSWVDVTAGREYVVSKKLRAAASDGTYEDVFQLVQGGANVTVSDTKGRTALHFAACRGDANMVKLLISYGAAVNQRDCNGNTPLHLGTDVNAADLRGMTPLHLAQSRLKLTSKLADEDSTVSSEGCQPASSGAAVGLSLTRKKEIELIVDMIRTYLHLTESSRDETDELEKLASKLSLSETPKQVDEVQNLLESFTSLSIEKRKET